MTWKKKKKNFKGVRIIWNLNFVDPSTERSPAKRQHLRSSKLTEEMFVGHVQKIENLGGKAKRWEGVWTGGASLPPWQIQCEERRREEKPPQLLWWLASALVLGAAAVIGLVCFDTAAGRSCHIWTLFLSLSLSQSFPVSQAPPVDVFSFFFFASLWASRLENASDAMPAGMLGIWGLLRFAAVPAAGEELMYLFVFAYFFLKVCAVSQLQP